MDTNVAAAAQLRHDDSPAVYRQPRAQRATALLALALLALGPGQSWTADEAPPDGAGVVVATAVVPSASEHDDRSWIIEQLEAGREPLVIGGLDLRVKRKLGRGYSIALARVREIDSCRALFTELDSDGLEKLLKTVYLPATDDQERRVCRAKDAAAVTHVGSAHTRVCKGFSRLSDNRAAVILIHEALHYAGLIEAPHYPDATMDSGDINRMVQEACGF